MAAWADTVGAWNARRLCCRWNGALAVEIGDFRFRAIKGNLKSEI
jgi:hypothetical protein